MTHLKYSLKKLKTLDVLFLTANAIFIFLYVILSVNNRISHDDFYSIYIVENFGVIEGMQLIYNNWCTRYIALLISFSITALLKFKGSLIIYQILLLLVASSSIYYLLNSLKKHLSCSIEKFQQINYSLFLSSALFYCSFNIGETWFWLSSNCTYLFSLIVMIGSLATCLTGRKNILSVIILIVSAFIIGGSNGTLSLFSLILISLVLLVSYIKKINFTISSSYLSLTIIFYLSLHFAFILMYIGNGNDLRSSYFKEIGILNALIFNFKYCGIFILKVIPTIIPYSILFSIPIMLINNDKSISLKKYMMKFLISFFCFLAIIYVFQLPITYKTQDIGAPRTLYPLAVFTFIFFSYNMYQIGKTLNNRKFFKKIISVLALLIIVSLNVYELYNQQQITSKYSKAYDIRLLQINEAIDNNLILLEPLPDAGFLHSAEISIEPNHYTNKQLKLGLQIKGEVKLKSN